MFSIETAIKLNRMLKMEMYCWYVAVIAASIRQISSDDVQSVIRNYFNTDTFKKFEGLWKNHQAAFELTLNMAVLSDFGYKAMNVYINRYDDPLELTSGYYHTDNQVHIVFQHMSLNEFPHIYDANFAFPLSSNVLSMDSSVSKMIVECQYLLFRNKSQIIYSKSERDPNLDSPFRYQQVRNVGELTMTIEGCALSGVFTASLDGNSVHLGHSHLQLTGCQYTIELYSEGLGAPPVIANYLPKGTNGLNIEDLLVRSLSSELTAKLQGSIYSYLNTSSILTDDLPKIREKQNRLFEDVRQYVANIVSGMNKKSIELNMGTTSMRDFSIAWDDVIEEMPEVTSIKIYNVLMIGLDTLYCSHTGGPFKLSELELMEQLRFGTLQIIGSIDIEKGQKNNEFAVEITDLAVDAIFDSNLNPKFKVAGWRNLEFSCPGTEKTSLESITIGYLQTEIPKHIDELFKNVFKAVGELQDLSGNVSDEFEEADDGINTEHAENLLENNEKVLETQPDANNPESDGSDPKKDKLVLEIPTTDGVNVKSEANASDEDKNNANLTNVTAKRVTSVSSKESKDIKQGAE